MITDLLHISFPHIKFKTEAQDFRNRRKIVYLVRPRGYISSITFREQGFTGATVFCVKYRTMFCFLFIKYGMLLRRVLAALYCTL